MRQNVIELMGAGNNIEMSFLVFMMNLGLAAFLSYVIGVFYVKYGRSVSDRADFSRNFILLSMTTMLVISIVKSSLALSLGLVGALSIVRFRAAIKEPEELTFLFLCIALGLGLGANQTLVTVAGLGGALFVLWLKTLLGKDKDPQTSNLFVTIAGAHGKADALEGVLAAIRTFFPGADMKRWDDHPDRFSASFMVPCVDMPQLKKFRDTLRAQFPDVDISAADARGL